MYVPVANPRKHSLASIARRADDSQATPGESAASSSSSSSTLIISTSTSTNVNESDGGASTTSSTSSVVTSQSTSSADNANKTSASSSVTSDVASSSAASSTLTTTSSSSSSTVSNATPTSSSVSSSSSTASSSAATSSTATTVSGNTSALSNGGASESTSASVANASIPATSTAAGADNSESSSTDSSSVTASSSSASVLVSSTVSSAALASSETPVLSSSLASSNLAAVPAPTVSSSSVPTPRDSSSASAVPSPSPLPSSSPLSDVSNVASSSDSDSDSSPSSTLTALASASTSASSGDLLSISLDPVGGVGSVLGGVNSVLGGVLGSGSDSSSTVDSASVGSAGQATGSATAVSSSVDATITGSDVASATSGASTSDTSTVTDSDDPSSATDISDTTDTGLNSTATDSSSSTLDSASDFSVTTTDSITQTIFFSSTTDNASPSSTDTTSETAFTPQGNGNKGVSSLVEPTTVVLDPQQRIAPTSVSSSSTAVQGNGDTAGPTSTSIPALPDTNTGSGGGNGSSDDSNSTPPQAVQNVAPTNLPSVEETIAVSGGSSVTLTTHPSLPTGTGNGTNNAGQPSGTASAGNAPASALSGGAIAGIIISIAGSAALVLLITFILLRRRRERARARLAHESFGPGVRSASSQSRHAPSPSGVAFLPRFLHGSNRSARSSNDSVRDGPGFFTRARAVFTPRRFGIGEKGMGMDQQWEIMNEKPTDVYERGLGAGEGSFLPPPVRAVSPIAPFPFMSSATSTHSPSNSGGNASMNPFSDPSSERAGTPVERGMAATPVPGSTPVPRADDPFWDPEDLLPPALRLSALQKETAAKKAAATASSSGAVPATGSDSSAHGFAGVGAYKASSFNAKGNITSPSDLMGQLPSDPFADPGIVAGASGAPSNASQGSKDKQPMKMPDIFDFRASGVSDSGADAEAAREGYTSWVSQPGWAPHSSTRSSGVSNDNAKGINQQQPPFTSSTPSLHTNLLGSGSDDRSVLASSYGSGVGPDSESSLHNIAAAGDSGVSLGMLRSESPRTLGSVSGETSSRMSYVSAESHGSSHYQEFGNAL